MQLNEPFSIKTIDLEYFKNTVLIFALSTIISLVLGFIGTNLTILLATFVEIIGLSFLAFGTMNLARKYPNLGSGTKASKLLILFIVIEIISSILYFLPFDSGPLMFWYIIAIIIDGIVMLISAHYFTNWFNLLFKEFNPIKSFYYFGIFAGIGSIGMGLGTFLVIRESNFYGENAFTYFLFLFIGSLMVIVGEIFYIIAGFKFYYRVNDKILGNTPWNRYQTPYYTGNRNIPDSNLYQYPPYGNQQLTTSKPTGLTSPSDNSSIDNSLQLTYCRNCGTLLETEARFCHYCGQIVQ